MLKSFLYYIVFFALLIVIADTGIIDWRRNSSVTFIDELFWAKLDNFMQYILLVQSSKIEECHYARYNTCRLQNNCIGSCNNYFYIFLVTTDSINQTAIVIWKFIINRFNTRMMIIKSMIIR